MGYRDKAQAIEHNNQYNKENYDRITIMLPKGSRDSLRAEAAARGYNSVTAFIRDAINALIGEGQGI